MLILLNANVLTFDPDQTHVAALAIKGSQIVAMGDNESILSLASRNDKVEDLSGQTIIPGMSDAHIHLLQYAQSLVKLNFENCLKRECLVKVQERAINLPIGAWILGHGWDQNYWNGDDPGFSDLDTVTSGHPVYLTSRSLHSAWVNSNALQKAGITSNTADPPGGLIGRDEHGFPNGLLYDNAVLLVENVIPSPSLDAASKMILGAIEKLHQLGLTSIHDFDDPICFDSLQEINREHGLSLRVCKNIPFTKWKKPIAELPRSFSGDDFLRFGSLKLFADGALGSRTAAMYEPYDDINSTGLLVSDSNQLLEIGQAAVLNGIGLSIHAIGDRANHEVLRAFQRLRAFEEINHLAHLKHRIEHVQCLRSDDVSIFAQSDIIASIQPVHAISDRAMARFAWGNRTKDSYPLKSLFDAGVVIVFGTDAPVENPNPFHTIHAAVTRNFPGDPPEVAFHPEQKVSLTKTFQAVCVNPHKIINQSNKLGSLRAGKLADLCVLPTDPFAVDPDNLYNMKISATMVAGKWVYLA